VRDRGDVIEVSTTVGERIGCHVEDTHHERGHGGKGTAHCPIEMSR
jgi:hypothetical protein